MEINELFSEMALAECREKTFKKWPFKRGSCTAKEMAKAGFYIIYQDSTESITCYYCFKELEGWEPSDIPYLEHRKHAPYCCFIKKFEKSPDSLTIQEICELELGRIERKMELEKGRLFGMIDAAADEIKKGLPSVVNNKKKPIRRRIAK